MSPSSSIKNKKGKVSESDVHLCWDCRKASIQGNCNVYESITSIIDDNFEEIKILFTISKCEYFEEEF